MAYTFLYSSHPNPYGSSVVGMSKPTLFIGSSSESLPVVEILATQLTAVADVRAWSDRGFFRPGLYYLDNLIQELPEFDFAVFIFGPDDAIESRGVVQSAPRDNVIFEFGYALAKLGRERVFHLVPKGPHVNVKVMSDLSGMKPWEYQLPDNFPAKLSDVGQKSTALPDDKKQHFREELALGLKDPCKFIGEAVDRLGPRRRFDRGITEGPQYVMDVYDDILQAFGQTDHNEVKNLALDMEQTWPAVRDRFIRNLACPHTDWRSLLIDPRSPSIKRLEGAAFSTTIAAAMIDNMGTLLGARHHSKNAVTYQCRAYASAPGIHGFLVNNTVAFISLCGLSRKWTDSISSPYLRFQKGSGIQAADHMVDSFRTLFDYHWEQSRRIWPKR